MAELLAVVTLREAILGFVNLRLNCDIAEAFQFKNFLGFRNARKGYEEKGQEGWCSFSGGTTGGCHLPDNNDIS
jgi:hypothetical protein